MPMRPVLYVAAICLTALPLATPPALAQADPARKAAAARQRSTPAAAPQQTEEERQAEAARLVGSAGEKLQRNYVDSAEEDLQKARQLYPEQQGLWGNLAAIALHRGNRAEAMDDLRKEIKLHPDSSFAWTNLIGLEMRDDKKAAEATAREWLTASPHTLAPRITLVRLLWASGQNPAALTAAKEAAATLPGGLREGNDFQMLLGQAEMHGGQMAAGAERLAHVIQGDATPLQVNDAVYQLAMAKQQLPIAEAMQRNNVRALGSRTLSWTDEEPAEVMHNISILITAAWDTMGWVLYQEGKYQQAEGFIQAAWRNRPTADIGEHLGDVETALHKNAEADRAYVLADSLATGAPAASATLKQKADAARQRGPVDLHGMTPVDYLNAQRTFPVAGTVDASGTAVYALLFTHDKILLVKPAPGGDTLAQDAAVRHANLSVLFPPDDDAALFELVKLTCADKQCTLRLM